MKSVKILAIAMLLSVAMPFVVLCNDSNIAGDVSQLVNDVKQEAPGLISSILSIPINLAASVFALTSSGVGYVLHAGSKVVENSGVLLTKVGDVGSCVVTTAQENRTLTGIVGLAAVYTFLKKTEVGRSIMQRLQKTVQTLLSLDEEDDATKCPCEDHRNLAAFLR